ncbi:MAG TPA: hypothetical protein DCZ94_10130 [Lentisphaeria bacterium]|nr:hypothetical protein [Lentisphaeria bacterium]
MFYLYILQSESTGRFYVGHTEDLENRLLEHNRGESKSTRNRGPWRPVYSETFQNRADAQRREYEIKSKKSSESIKRIIRHQHKS